MRVALALLVVAACHGKQELTAPPPPLRPEPEPVVEQSKGLERKDCEPTSPDRELKALTFDERSIPEGQKLADEAKGKFKSATSTDMERATREQYITDAVDELITALRADPYNVTATYYLAAAYAKIGRTQCSINLLTRLLQMRPHPSKHTEVEQALDRLLGRKQALDPDFSDMRKDERFRHLIEKMCEGTGDANCVYGGQTNGRER